MSAPFAILAGIVLLAANGFFVAAEFALLAARRSRLEQLAAEGDRRARHAVAGKRELSLMLAGAQLGITICSLLLGAIAEPAIAQTLENALDQVVDIPDAALHSIGFVVALSIVVFLHMVVGEMAPKSWAISHPEASALSLARLFRMFALVFRPAIRVLNAIANAVIRALGVEPQDELAMAHSPTDLLLLLDEAAHHGSIDPVEHQLFARSLELSGLDAGGAMTPRRMIVSVDASEPVTAVAAAARATGRSRIVVHEGDLDHIVGVAHVKDVLALHPQQRQQVLARDVARASFVVHEHKLLEDLLVDMQARRQHLALVVDEHGVVVGLVTLEDVIEELIGDFQDESDRHSRRCRRLNDHSWALAGDLRPDELTEQTGIALPEGEWETVAGFVISVLDRIPTEGDSIEMPGFALDITRLDGFAVDRIRLRLSPDHQPSRPQPSPSRS